MSIGTVSLKSLQFYALCLFEEDGEKDREGNRHSILLWGKEGGRVEL